MDESIKMLAGLLAGGGNAALLFLVFVGWRAANAAREVAQDIRELKEAMKAQGPKLDAIARNVDDLERSMRQQEVQLTAALARGQ